MVSRGAYATPLAESEKKIMRLRWELGSLSAVVISLAVTCMLTFWATQPEESAVIDWGEEEWEEERCHLSFLPEPYDNEPRLGILFSEKRRIGLSILRQADPLCLEKPKRITRDECGRTSNTCVSIDGREFDYGQETAEARWQQLNSRPLKEIRDGAGRRWLSIMEYASENIRIMQSVELVVGEQTRLYDTALIKYVIWNRDNEPHTVGLRAMIDTHIGANDGTPFFIPPTEDAPAHFVDTREVFEGDRIPVFLRVLESNDLNDTGTVMTVAEMGLRLRGIEPMERVVICRWQPATAARWDWPFRAMNDPPGAKKDSCVVLYWARRAMQPGEKRTLAYTYGLGRITGEICAGDICVCRCRP